MWKCKECEGEIFENDDALYVCEDCGECSDDLEDIACKEEEGENQLRILVVDGGFNVSLNGRDFGVFPTLKEAIEGAQKVISSEN